MREDEKNQTIERYNKRLALYGYDPKTLGWTKGKQEIRFNTLTQIGNFSNSSILDVGCGFGDLYGFLKKRGLTFDYTGVDLNSALISIGHKKYPDATLIAMEFEDEVLDREYDWIVCSGMFNHRMKNNIRFIKNNLRKMFQMSIKGVAADFISSYVNFRYDDVYYAHPETIIRFSKSLSRRIILRHDYLPFEFCVYIYRSDQFNENTEFVEQILSDKI
jgi:SAM-dependent methyltransferase